MGALTDWGSGNIPGPFSLAQTVRPNVRSWHLADIHPETGHVRSWGKADIADWLWMSANDPDGFSDAPPIRATFECYIEIKRARLVMRRVVPHMVYYWHAGT